MNRSDAPFMLSTAGRIARIRTSDRNTFKRCRRLWGWTSGLRGNRGSREPIVYLWLGSGFHYACEDYHGYNFFGKPSVALQAFSDAWKRAGLIHPDDWQDNLQLGKDMLDHYSDVWLSTRDPLKTLWIDNIPQLEVVIEIDLTNVVKNTYGYAKVLYQFTADRLVIDEYGRLWILDYKTAKSFEIYHLLNDPQVSAYVWGGNATFDQPIAGMIYQQHRKAIPDEPYILSSGEISVNKAQKTTHLLYRKSLINLYGSIPKAPAKNVDFLNWLATQEDDLHDAFIRRDYAERSEVMNRSTGTKILMEIEDMLNPDLPLYPTETRACSYCSFFNPCVSLDDDLDWEQALEDISVNREELSESWRKYLVLP